MKKLQKKLSGVFRKRKSEQEQGSSLLEVTVALLVANVGLLAVAQLIAVASVMNKNSSNMVESSRAAQTIIEPLRAQAYANLTTTTNPTTTKYNQRYNVTTAVTELPNVTNLKKISVTVQDTNYDMKGGSRSYTFVNYRTNDENPKGSYFNSALTVVCSTSTNPNCGSTTNTTGS